MFSSGFYSVAVKQKQKYSAAKSFLGKAKQNQIPWAPLLRDLSEPWGAPRGVCRAEKQCFLNSFTGPQNLSSREPSLGNAHLGTCRDRCRTPHGSFLTDLLRYLYLLQPQAPLNLPSVQTLPKLLVILFLFPTSMESSDVCIVTRDLRHMFPSGRACDGDTSSAPSPQRSCTLGCSPWGCRDKCSRSR